ncbi:uncharacterized protein LOC115623013 [Scaptodrosophila lebanonensis]|uniref:Uncharacterized protein LOC115623013 n=1 Tax=Drosophila lebanonensis TaxID=7225 RepID=A0A6J2TDH7_DROLE|nr:uncharacterized protein LOC115623013 [Scaptodrosophila lebanonensis]
MWSTLICQGRCVFWKRSAKSDYSKPYTMQLAQRRQLSDKERTENRKDIAFWSKDFDALLKKRKLLAMVLEKVEKQSLYVDEMLRNNQKHLKAAEKKLKEFDENPKNGASIK